MKHTSNSTKPLFEGIVAASKAPGPSDLVSGLTQPQSVVSHGSVHHASRLEPSQKLLMHEFDTLEWGRRLNGPEDITFSTAGEIEEDANRSSPVSPNVQENAVSTVPTLRTPYMNRWRAAACLVGYFTQGINDSVVGALLPYMERQYRTSYAVISLLFVARAIGFLSAGPLAHKFNQWFGRSTTLATCATINMIAYIMIITQPPYPVLILAFYLSGFGFATISALDNVFVVNLQGGTVLLGFMQGFYGIGGIVAPFVATTMVSHGAKWSYFYIILLSLSGISAAAFFTSFKGYETEETTIALLATLDRDSSQQVTRQSATRSVNKGTLKNALTNRTTLLGGLLAAAYQGAEVSISGWVISFLIDYRKGDPARVGYVTSGFWGGITLGRFALVMPAHKIGDGLSLIVLTVATIGFQIMVWLLPDVVGNAVAVAIIGLLQGPIYPCAAGAFARLLPSRLQVTGLGLISGMGSSGGALAPFCTGLLAQSLGTIVLNPVCIALYVVMLASWSGLPTIPKRTE